RLRYGDGFGSTASHSPRVRTTKRSDDPSSPQPQLPVSGPAQQGGFGIFPCAQTTTPSDSSSRSLFFALVAGAVTVADCETTSGCEPTSDCATADELPLPAGLMFVMMYVLSL